MEDKYTKTLPVGTVVKIKGSDEQLVIISLVPVAEVNGEKGYFDFGAASLPTGVTSNQLIFFNKENIETIIYLGYVDAKFQDFAARYDELTSQVEYKKLIVDVDVEEN